MSTGMTLWPLVWLAWVGFGLQPYESISSLQQNASYPDQPIEDIGVFTITAKLSRPTLLAYRIKSLALFNKQTSLEVWNLIGSRRLLGFRLKIAQLL